MVRRSARILLGAGLAILAAALAGSLLWNKTAPSAPAPVAKLAPAPAPAGSASASAASRRGGKQHAAVPKFDNPQWKSLTPAQQQVLQPLAGEWDQLESLRKQKWLEIASRYSSMKPDEQARVQERMHDWIKLTPEERRVVRQNFARAQKLGPSHKSAQWEEYQQLPEEQKKKLAENAAQNKQIAAVPTLAESKIKTVAPIKAGVQIPPAGGQSVPAAPAGTAAPAAPAAPATPAAAAPAPLTPPAAPASGAPASPAPAPSTVPASPAATTNVK